MTQNETKDRLKVRWRDGRWQVSHDGKVVHNWQTYPSLLAWLENWRTATEETKRRWVLNMQRENIRRIRNGAKLIVTRPVLQRAVRHAWQEGGMTVPEPTFYWD